MATLDYQGKITGAQVDKQIQRVIDGSVVTDNTEQTIVIDSAKPASCGAVANFVSNAIEKATKDDIYPSDTSPVSGVAVVKALSPIKARINALDFAITPELFEVGSIEFWATKFNYVAATNTIRVKAGSEIPFRKGDKIACAYGCNFYVGMRKDGVVTNSGGWIKSWEFTEDCDEVAIIVRPTPSRTITDVAATFDSLTFTRVGSLAEARERVDECAADIGKYKVIITAESGKAQDATLNKNTIARGKILAFCLRDPNKTNALSSYRIAVWYADGTSQTLKSGLSLNLLYRFNLTRDVVAVGVGWNAADAVANGDLVLDVNVETLGRIEQLEMDAQKSSVERSVYGSEYRALGENPTDGNGGYYRYHLTDIRVAEGDIVEVNTSGAANTRFAVQFAFADGVPAYADIISDSGWMTKQTSFHVVPENSKSTSTYIKLNVSHSDNSYITEADARAYITGITIHRGVGARVKENCRNAGIVKAINHRGWHEAPENTLVAYCESKMKGFDYVEADVRATKDGVLVLCHDSSIDRTSNGSGEISSMTLAQLRTYDFGSYKAARYAGTTIPTLDEFLKTCRALGLHAYLDIKGGTAEAIVSSVLKNGMRGHVTYTSFSSSMLSQIVALDSEARVGLLCDTVTSSIVAEAKKIASPNIFISSGTRTDSEVQLCIAAGIPMEYWSANSSSHFHDIHPYITGFISDSYIVNDWLVDGVLRKIGW